MYTADNPARNTPASPDTHSGRSAPADPYRPLPAQRMLPHFLLHRTLCHNNFSLYHPAENNNISGNFLSVLFLYHLPVPDPAHLSPCPGHPSDPASDPSHPV